MPWSAARDCASGARRRPGRWTVLAARAIGIVLAADAVSFTVSQAVQGTWSASTSLPLALCNMAVLVAVAACWWQIPLLVELTWFWGMAGTLQAVVTPDLAVGFPHLVFFQYVIGHLGIVLAPVYLVAGMRITPRAGSVRRVLTVAAAYTAAVGIVDILTGANYMFLRRLGRVLNPSFRTYRVPRFGDTPPRSRSWSSIARTSRQLAAARHPSWLSHPPSRTPSSARPGDDSARFHSRPRTGADKPSCGRPLSESRIGIARHGIRCTTGQGRLRPVRLEMQGRAPGRPRCGRRPGPGS